VEGREINAALVGGTQPRGCPEAVCEGSRRCTCTRLRVCPECHQHRAYAASRIR
jgi:hypothetical protein